ncbi:MAG: purine-cytosine permease family protein [Actinomycetales bacterium]
MSQKPQPSTSTLPAEHESGAGEDYTNHVVPLAKRKTHLKMLLTFLSMQATFPAVYVGYTARFEGMNIARFLVAMALATAIMTLYCIGSANAGAVAGQTSSVMTRSIFGRAGSAVVSALLVVDGMGFYLFTVLFVISLLGGLFTISSATLLGVVLAAVMITNTYFGFGGVQKFAQWVAVPLILVWGVYATIRALATVDGHALANPPHVDSAASILFVAGAMVGLSTWGNEADIFRYAKPDRKRISGTVVLSYVVGSFLFPILGYLIATMANTSDFSASIKYFVNFSLFGLTLLGILFFVINQVGVNDGNLYIAVNGAQNLLSHLTWWRRRYTVLALGAIAAVLVTVLPSLQKTFTIVTGIGAVTVPTASTIMAVDIFVMPRLTGIRRPLSSGNDVPSWQQTATGNWLAVVALLSGTLVGAVTGGLIPGTSGFGNTYIGFPPLQAWLTGAAVYLVGVVVLTRRSDPQRTSIVLGFPSLGPPEITPPPEPAVVEPAEAPLTTA